MVDLVVVPHSDGLDEIRVYFEDVGAGRGYITMICWGAGWTAYFGGMGEDTIRMFVERVGADYLVNKMGNGSHLKQRKVDDNYLRKIVDAVKKHLKANPVATYTMGIDAGSEPDYTAYQLIKERKVVDEGRLVPGMSGTPINVEPFRPDPKTHSCFPYIASESTEGISYEQMGLDPTTWPSYGGITRSGDPNALKHGEYPNSDAGGIDSFPIRPPSEWFCDPAKYSRKELDVLLQKGSISEEKYNELMREKVDRIHREIKESQEED